MRGFLKSLHETAKDSVRGQEMIRQQNLGTVIRK